MMLYHGSNIGGIKALEPKLAGHDRAYVYLSTLEIVAGFYTVNAVDRPYFWFPYGYDRDGTVVYDELYPNALKEVYEGHGGFLYTVEAGEKDILPFGQNPCARLGTAPMKVISCVEIGDCYRWLTEQIKAGKFKLRKYEDKSEKEMQDWYKMIYRYIQEKSMIDAPDCSYAVFVKRKFPGVWEQYIQDDQK